MPAPPITKSIARVDRFLKVTGAAKYADDFAAAGLVHTQLIQSTYSTVSALRERADHERLARMKNACHWTKTT
jgi:CO/xanthine dehydrogenase Mo-binding subunit